MIKTLFFIFKIFLLYQLFISICLADLQKDIINKLTATQTLTFDFKQKIGEEVEFGNCYIKYPLFMKCDYPKKKKSIIANGKKFAIIKRRYKKI